MKTYTIKNYSGQKTLIVNDIANSDIKCLYKIAREMNISFAVKQEIGIQIWGLQTVCEYLGVQDCTKIFN